MKKIKKMDEMEMQINYKSIRNAYGFVIISLFVWFSYNFYETGSPLTTPFMLFMMVNIIYFGSSVYLQRKMSKGIDENEE